MGRGVKPFLEQTQQLGVGLNTKHLQEHPNNFEVPPVATPAVLPTSPNSSRRSPTAWSTSPRSPPGPPSPSSASSPSFLSSLPGFLIQSALYVVLATSLLRLPLPTVLAGH